MEANETKEIYSKAIKAGKRTYFLDVKEMRSGDKYLIITESKRKALDENGRFIYEKHKIFLFKEDFEKFTRGLNQTLNFINTGEIPPPDPEEEQQQQTYNHNSYQDSDDDGFDKL
jgi:hypothetical protein